MLHRGRGITAGYPVLAVVTLAGQDALAQARPGSGVRFRLQSIEEARVVARQRLAQREALASRVRSLLSARWDRVAENRWTEPFPPACYSRESGVNSSGSGALDAIA